MTQSSPKRFKLAFTLIELLVVIAIIVVLMGLLFPVVGAVKEQGRKVAAKNDVTSMVNAVKAYYTEYGKYPTDNTAITGTNDVTYGVNPANGGVGNYAVIDVLRNNTASVSGTLVASLNPRQIVFLEVSAVKDPSAPKSGVTVANTSAPGTAGTWYDPWGNQYNLAIDNSYDNTIDQSAHGYSDPNFVTINTGVIAWSYGKDKAQGTNGNKTYAGSDDVISWQ